MAESNHTFPVEQFFFNYLMQSCFSECYLLKAHYYLQNLFELKLIKILKHVIICSWYCMVLSCVVFNSKVLFTLFTIPCLEKHVYEGVGFQKGLWTNQGVFLDRDISAGGTAISFHINTAWHAGFCKCQPGKAVLGQWCGHAQLHGAMATSAWVKGLQLRQRLLPPSPLPQAWGVL